MSDILLVVVMFILIVVVFYIGYIYGYCKACNQAIDACDRVIADMVKKEYERLKEHKNEQRT